MTTSIIKISFILIMICSLIFVLIHIKHRRIPKEEFKKMCRKMAGVDSDIVHNELEGNSINGKEIVFPPKDEDIQYRYKLFLEMYKGYTIEELEKEYEKLLERLEDSKQYIDEESVDLEVEFTE